MKLSIPIVLVISILLASCATGPLTQVNMKVADTYSRHIWLIPRIQGAQKLVVLDVSGHGNTVPVHWDVCNFVIKISKTLDITSGYFHVRRSGDSSPIMITAEIP